MVRKQPLRLIATILEERIRIERYLVINSIFTDLSVGFQKKEVLLLLGLRPKRKVVIWRIGLQVRMPPFHGGKSGALPLCATMAIGFLVLMVAR